MTTAKLFWSGNSQAIRLPKSFRLEGDKVFISKQGNSLIIRPCIDDWQWLDKLDDTFDVTLEDSIKALHSEQSENEDWGVFE